MTITLKWTDKRYKEGINYTHEFIPNNEWKKIKEMFKIITKRDGDKYAENYLKRKFTNSKNRNKLISLMTEENKSYWTIYFKEN